MDEAAAFSLTTDNNEASIPDLLALCVLPCYMSGRPVALPVLVSRLLDRDPLQTAE